MGKKIEKQKLHVQTLKVGEETTNFDEQVNMSLCDGTIEGHDKSNGDINGKDMQQLVKKVHYKEIY